MSNMALGTVKRSIGIFLARFLITIVLSIISSLRTVFSPRARVDWCDVCIDFTNLIKVDVDVDVNKMSVMKIKQEQYSRDN